MLFAHCAAIHMYCTCILLVLHCTDGRRLERLKHYYMQLHAILPQVKIDCVHVPGILTIQCFSRCVYSVADRWSQRHRRGLQKTFGENL